MDWLNIFGLIMIAVIMIPNIIFAVRCKEGFQNKWSNKFVEVAEQIGRFGCFGFMIINIPGTWFGWWSDEAFAIYLIVETVVLLSHKKPDGHINVKVEFGEGEGKVPLDNIAKRAEEYKPKERVTYKMIKEYIEAKYGFKVHTAYIAEVKRDLGLPMYDAPNAVEELKQPRKHPTAEKVEAIKDALKHFEVI